MKTYSLAEYLSLEFLKENHERLKEYYNQNKLLSILVYTLIYIVATALSLPGATLLNLAGGSILGFSVGLLTVSFASTIGATCAFLGARFYLKDYIQYRFAEK